MAKLGYEAMLLPGEELMYKIQGVYDISQPANAIGTLYITSFQTFFVDEARGQLKDLIPHGCVSSLKKYKNQSTNNVPITDKTQYLEVRCKDLRILKYLLPSSSRPSEVRRYLEYAILPDNLHDIFAFSYSPQIAALDEGWNVYNPLEEYRRIGLHNPQGGGPWRVSEFNMNFVNCPTYPELLVVPSAVSDEMLKKVADFRSKARLPVCVWKHPRTHATISRCSQPLVGIGRRCEEDEKLFKEIQQANRDGKNKTLYIVDARPKVNAAACTLSGGGTEIVGNYSESNSVLEYCGIANIHVVRESFKRLGKVCRAWDSRSKLKWSDVTSTHWLDHIASILTAACRIVAYAEDACSVVTHCTDGWDRTSQLCALAELMMDPYYRTFRGFIVLICKEFISFGHKLNTRNGNLSHQPRSQSAPIFIQFMDCVWQLTRQFPTSFEFSENLLLLITTHLYTHLFGTFLCDNDCERASVSLNTQTASLWGLILRAPPALFAHLVNPMYTQHPGTLHGNGHANGMQLWRTYYQRGVYNKEEGQKEKEKEEEEADEEEKNNNGLKKSGDGQIRVVDATLLHEMELIPFFDTLSPSEKAIVRQDMAAWLSMGGGRIRDKTRIVIKGETTKEGHKEKEKEKEKEKVGGGTVSRSASQPKGIKASSASDDEREPEENGGERTIKRGRSFMHVLGKISGKGTVRDKKKEEEKESDSHNNSHNNNFHNNTYNNSHNNSYNNSYNNNSYNNNAYNNNNSFNNNSFNNNNSYNNSYNNNSRSSPHGGSQVRVIGGSPSSSSSSNKQNGKEDKEENLET